MNIVHWELWRSTRRSTRRSIRRSTRRSIRRSTRMICEERFQTLQVYWLQAFTMMIMFFWSAKQCNWQFLSTECAQWAPLLIPKQNSVDFFFCKINQNQIEKPDSSRILKKLLFPFNRQRVETFELVSKSNFFVLLQWDFRWRISIMCLCKPLHRQLSVDYIIHSMNPLGSH